MTVTRPEQEQLPGLAGLAIGGVFATFGSLGAPDPASLPLQLVGGTLAILSIAYLLVLLWIADLAT